ncbi:hypothetical protein KIPB_004732 [Kipferlia bialata]|uniref:G domain-containing protein n=1 Tax=Kipferlia bialata TaxID=797122 RepID=A0A9K3GIE8_9EUKA|nr:hypothetical protein KIPB_004732 [Kipferlia bialata]|eukprot:g4732.t1
MLRSLLVLVLVTLASCLTYPDPDSDVFVVPERVTSLYEIYFEDALHHLPMGETHFTKPPAQVRVLLFGNHGAGKSSFVTHTVERPGLLPTGIAMTTDKITYVTGGGSDSMLDSRSSVGLFPELDSLFQRYPTLPNHFSTRVYESDKHSPILFIDTPGTVDTQVSYGFDINAVINDLAKTSDLILVFLDPHGQSLCQRTLDVIRTLASDPQIYERMVFVLSKVDLLTDGFDKLNLMVQITQNLAFVVPQKGFKIHPMVLPEYIEASDPHNAEVLRELNALDEIHGMLIQALSRRAQDAAHSFKALVERVDVAVAEVIALDDDIRSQRSTVNTKVFLGAVIILSVCYFGWDKLADQVENGHWKEVLGCSACITLVGVVVLKSRPALLDTVTVQTAKEVAPRLGYLRETAAHLMRKIAAGVGV